MTDAVAPDDAARAEARIERARIEAAADRSLTLVGLTRTLSMLDDVRQRVAMKADADREGWIV